MKRWFWLLPVVLVGCDEIKEATEVTAQVGDDHGQPVEGATVRLYDLVGHPEFVEGGDLGAGEAYIDRAAVLASDDPVETATTGADGRAVFSAFPGAFLAVATKEGCTAGFAGFDEETGVLSLDTLITPELTDGLGFEIPPFVLACGTAPPPEDLDPPGNTAEAPPYDAPGPEEIEPPAEALGWTSFRITDPAGGVLADASAGNVVLDPVPADGLVRVYGDYDGAADTAYLWVQSGATGCPGIEPHADAIPIELADGRLSTGAGDYLELLLHRGYQQLQLGTGATLGEGDQSFVVGVGSDTCAPPTTPFTVELTWDAGPGEPADLDLSVWSEAGELVYLGDKDAAWGQLELEGEGPGPEVFTASDPTAGPFLVKVEFFSGKPRDVEAHVRVTRTVQGQSLDETFTVTVSRPKDIVEVGVFAAE